MRWAGLFAARHAILHHFKTNTAIISKLCWNCFTITWVELYWLVFEKWANSAERASSPHVIVQSGLSMSMRRLIKNNKITKFECGKVWWKNKMANNISEHVSAADTDLNTKFKWLDDLVEYLLKALSNFKTVMDFQNLEISFNKGSLFTKFHRWNVGWTHISHHLSFLQWYFTRTSFFFRFLCFCFIFLNRMFGFTILE